MCSVCSTRPTHVTSRWGKQSYQSLAIAQAEKAHRGGAIVRLGLEALYVLAHFFAPFIPNTTAAIEQKLGHKLTTIIALKDDFQNLVPGTKVSQTLDPSHPTSSSLSFADPVWQSHILLYELIYPYLTQTQSSLSPVPLRLFRVPSCSLRWIWRAT